MCLTIPKKVVAVCEDGLIELELHDGTRQKVKTMVDLEIGSFCLTQQNVAIEKITAQEAKEILKILDGGGRSMKLTKNGLALLSGIVRSCMAKRAESCSDDQLGLSTDPKMISLDKFRQIFPLEAGTAERLIIFAKALKKENIDEEAVALFFGGEEHIGYALNNIREQGIRNGVAKILLIFHMLVPVQITKEKSGVYSGLYNNQGQEIIFKNIQSVLCGETLLSVGQLAFVHYGYVVRPAVKKLCETVLEEQSDNRNFTDACMRVATIDCGKLLSAFQPMRKR